MHNIIQYGSFLVAVGCRLRYNSATAELDIVEYPKDSRRKEAVTDALTDIAKFMDTANYTDGMAAIHLAEDLDDGENPIPAAIRTIVLNALGIMHEDRFVTSIMLLAKSNRSWHKSEKPNECTAFGRLCTHRGTVIDPAKRGLRSNRAPHEYHVQTAPNSIRREQFVTPALEKAYSLIPADMLTTGKSTGVEQMIGNMDVTQLDALIATAQRLREKQNA